MVKNIFLFSIAFICGFVSATIYWGKAVIKNTLNIGWNKIEYLLIILPLLVGIMIWFLIVNRKDTKESK